MVELFLVLGLIALPLLLLYDKYLAPRVRSSARRLGYSMMASSWSQFPVERFRVREVIESSWAPITEHGPHGEAYVRGQELAITVAIIKASTGAFVGEFAVQPPLALHDVSLDGRLIVGQVGRISGSEATFRVDWAATEEAWASDENYRRAPSQ